jgi:hypothetical protein
VNGSVGYVAAEAADLRINNGLFDITVATGSGDAHGIIHTGNTGGPASTGSGDNHRIYMVAVPKNQAITALLSGSAGFDPAVSATVENGQIVLSSGFNVKATNSGGTTPATGLEVFGGACSVCVPNRAGSGDASFHINGGSYSSSVVGRAVTDFFAASLAGTPTFSGDLTIHAGARAHVGARRAGETLSVGGNLQLSADDIKNFSVANPNINPEINSQGGQSLLYTENGGSVLVNGSARISADAQAAQDTVVRKTFGLARGGDASVIANGGSIRVGGGRLFPPGPSRQPAPRPHRELRAQTSPEERRRFLPSIAASSILVVKPPSSPVPGRFFTAEMQPAAKPP